MPRGMGIISNYQYAKRGLYANQGGGGITSCSGAGQSFNGTDQYAYVADNGALDIVEATTDFCMSFFIKSDSATAEGFIGKNVYGTPDGEYGIELSNNGLSVTFIWRTDVDVYAKGTTISNDIMYHILVRIDITNSKLYFYLDGVLANEGGTSYTGNFVQLGSDYRFVIGAWQNAVGIRSYCKGTAKDVRIYHKNVVPDLTALMAGKKLGDEVAWWCLPGLDDISDNSYDLTGVNL